MHNLFFNTNNINRSCLIWNMIGSLLYAFQSVIFLIILTRTVGLVYSGIFTIAFANANLFLNIGKYGMRNYQVSDVKNDYSFTTYLHSRVITTFIMLVVSLLYTLFTANQNHYTLEKTQIIIWMCLFKIPDAVEDIYYGEYQKQGRLDVASKLLTTRMFLTLTFFSTTSIISKNLLYTLVLSTCFTSFLAFVFITLTYKHFEKEKIGSSFTQVKRLLITCFPLFLSTFLSFYIGNAPKYAIDAQLSDELQACYGFIAMPVFVIGLLNNFIFNPLLYKISKLWNEHKSQQFIYSIIRQICVVVIITITCIIGAYFLGIPVLSILYNTDLSMYKVELIILLLGGGFLSITGVLNTAITIIRYQKSLLLGYGVVSALALTLSNIVVEKYKMIGAASLYASLMLLLCLCFSFALSIGIKKKHHEIKPL